MFMLPPLDQIVVQTTDHLEAFPNPDWRGHVLCAAVTHSQWVDLRAVKEQCWLSDDAMAVVNRQTVRACGDFFLGDGRRLVLHLRREPTGADPFPTRPKAVINGALWPSGGMLVKPTGDLDGKLDLTATVLIKARRELGAFLQRPEDIRGVYSAGFGFTTFHTKATYTLGDGRTREVELEAGRSSTTLNATAYIEVAPEVIDSLVNRSAEGTADFTAHVVFNREEWQFVRPHCLAYVQRFVDNYWIA